ncbi:MAG: VOC family protein [Nevskiales bacterium]|nr:VOC family protein [Nevskiales bacterium]
MAIFTHVAVGTNDVDQARVFYDAVLEPLGVGRVMDLERGSMWGTRAGPELLVTQPFNGEPATYANGGTVSFAAHSRAAVDAFHKVALAHGGRDEGAPGPRPFSPTAYAAYVRDPDGNKLCAYCFVPE